MLVWAFPSRRIQSSHKRTWSYPLYRILRGLPVLGGPSKSFNTAAHRFPFLSATWKAGCSSSDEALRTSPHPFLTEATKMTRHEKGLPFTALLRTLSRKIENKAKPRELLHLLSSPGVHSKCKQKSKRLLVIRISKHLFYIGRARATLLDISCNFR